MYDNFYLNEIRYILLLLNNILNNLKQKKCATNRIRSFESGKAFLESFQIYLYNILFRTDVV